MKLNSGSVIVNKSVHEVFEFSRNLAYFSEELRVYDLDDYELETDDGVEGILAEGDVFTVYAFAKYEGDKDLVFDFEILKIRENEYITFRVKRVGIYQNEDDEYDDTKELPMPYVWGKIELGVIFFGVSGKTKVKLVTYVNPSAGKMLRVIAWVMNAVTRFKSNSILKQWAMVVEKYA